MKEIENERLYPCVSVFPLAWLHLKRNTNSDIIKKKKEILFELLNNIEHYNLFLGYSYNTTDTNNKKLLDIYFKEYLFKQIAIDSSSDSSLVCDALSISYLTFNSLISRIAIQDANKFFCNALNYKTQPENLSKNAEIQKYNIPVKMQIVHRTDNNISTWVNPLDNYLSYHILYNPTITVMNSKEEVEELTKDKLNKIIKDMSVRYTYDILTAGDNLLEFWRDAILEV